jgi:hypothetical protein
MMKSLPTLILFLLIAAGVKAQNLNWHVTAQAGTANHHLQNFQGSLLGGFKTEEGQQLSFGPVVKGFEFNQQLKNVYGARIYSQVKAVGSVSFYLQCDIFDGAKSNSIVATKSPMRLETGAGVIYTYRGTVGLSAGYNMAELNPVSGIRRNTPSIKLIYLVPFVRNW